MSLYVNTMVATEHRNQLIREAAAWRRGREAKRAAGRRRKTGPAQSILPAEPTVYCSRAAAFNLRSAS